MIFDIVETLKPTKYLFAELTNITRCSRASLLLKLPYSLFQDVAENANARNAVVVLVPIHYV